MSVFQREVHGESLNFYEPLSQTLSMELCGLNSGCEASDVQIFSFLLFV